MINGGFGLLLDGSEEAAQRARTMLAWDVSNGVSSLFKGSTPVICHASQSQQALSDFSTGQCS